MNTAASKVPPCATFAAEGHPATGLCRRKGMASGCVYLVASDMFPVKRSGVATYLGKGTRSAATCTPSVHTVSTAAQPEESSDAAKTSVAAQLCAPLCRTTATLVDWKGRANCVAP
eukprot:645008-Rhodomonas_salina.1